MRSRRPTRPSPRPIRRHPALCALLCAAITFGSAAAAEARFDSDWILRALARPVPMRTDFVEVRDSPLLKAPLRLSGEYRRPDADTLVREVRAPYAETTTLRGGEAVIARAGKSPRRFALSRVPELAGLQASFGAMLAGDRARLARDFDIVSRGRREAWAMTLVPKDAALREKIRDITLYGRGAELRCIETRPAQGETLQRTLLAGAARRAQGEAIADPAALAALCRGDARG